MTLRTKVHAILIPSIIVFVAAFFVIPNMLMYTAMAIFFIIISYFVGALYTVIFEAIVNHIEHGQ